MLPAFNPVCHMVKGNHRDTIIRLAIDLQADLVVVGTAAHSGITDFIVDSTATIITRQMNCSVVVVKPPEFVTPVAAEEF